MTKACLQNAWGAAAKGISECEHFASEIRLPKPIFRFTLRGQRMYAKTWWKRSGLKAGLNFPRLADFGIHPRRTYLARELRITI